MAAFPKMTLTNAGQALQTKVLSGAQLTFTRIALGDGQLNDQPIVLLTALIHQTASVTVQSVRVIGTSTCQVSGFFSNTTITQGFQWRETGIFAQDPDVGEILYGYTNAGGAGDYIPTAQDTRIEKYIFTSIAVANAQTVNITIPASDSFIPVTDKGIPGGVATLDSSGKVPSNQLPAMNYIPTSEKGQPSGVATLDTSGKLTSGQLPTIAASGVTYDNGASGMTATNVQAALDELQVSVENAAAKALYTTITLPQSGWSALSQTVTVNGIQATEMAQMITVVPSYASQQEFYTAEVIATAQAENSLTFTCAQTPASDLTVYVVVMGVTTG